MRDFDGYRVGEGEERTPLDLARPGADLLEAQEDTNLLDRLVFPRFCIHSLLCIQARNLPSSARAADVQHNICIHTPARMPKGTLTDFDFHYVKLLVSPRSPDTMPIDQATLHTLLQRTALESFGTIGASLGEAVSIVETGTNAPSGVTEASAREVTLRLSKRFVARLSLPGSTLTMVSLSAITPFLAMLPMSSASEQFSFEILGQSPSLPLVNAATTPAKVGSLDWLNSFSAAS